MFYIMKKYNSNQPEYYYGIGKDGIVKEGIFERFPDLIPAIGDHYWREDGAHKKMLLVGESNYFNDNDVPHSDFKDAEAWYKSAEAKLIPEYRKTHVRNWIGYETFNKVFNIMNKVLSSSGIKHEKGLQETGFYNYFLRPACDDGKNKGFMPQNIDKEVSGTALTGIIEKISPDLIIFLSKKAYTEFTLFLRRNNLAYDGIEHVSHPASIWWNRDGGIHGKVKFEDLLRKYWINK